jgi:hypothetical protein
MSIANRVAKGAAILDKCRPGWWMKIDTNRLNILTYQSCVIGQLYGFGGFDRGITELKETAGGLNFFFSFRHGFYGWIPSEYNQLTSEWKRVIEARKTQKRLEVTERRETIRLASLPDEFKPICYGSFYTQRVSNEIYA